MFSRQISTRRFKLEIFLIRAGIIIVFASQAKEDAPVVEKPAPKSPKKVEKAPPAKKAAAPAPAEKNGDPPKRGRGRPPKRSGPAAKAAANAKKGKVHKNIINNSSNLKFHSKRQES